MNGALTQFVSILTMIIVVAIIAVLVSKKSQTSQVIQAFSSGLANILGTVVSPITSS